MAKTTRHYEVRFQGAVVGTRKSESRDYTHAVVVRRNVETARKAAYEYLADKGWEKQDRANWQFACDVASGKLTFSHMSESSKVRYANEAAMGFDAFRQRRLAEVIERFEQQLKSGFFEIHVHCYNGRRDLALKEAARLHGNPYFDLIEVVEVTRVK